MLDWLRTVAPRQRWFADKTRSVEDVSVRWSATLPGAPEIDLAVVEFRFDAGPHSLYFVPFNRKTRTEATSSPEFIAWLLDSLDSPSLLPEGMTWLHLMPRDVAASISREAPDKPGGSPARRA
jgi:hypothetical protein